MNRHSEESQLLKSLARQYPHTIGRIIVAKFPELFQPERLHLSHVGHDDSEGQPEYLPGLSANVPKEQRAEGETNTLGQVNLVYAHPDGQSIVLNDDYDWRVEQEGSVLRIVPYVKG